MKSAEVLQIYHDLQSGKINPSSIIDPEQNPLILPDNVRPYSASIGDIAFGDGGKGATTAKLNSRFREQGKDIFSLRANGGANAGHETLIEGKLIVTHQLPSGVLEEGVTPVMSRGMVIHPRDLLLEIADVKKQLGGTLPSDPLIDANAILSLDTHRALEKAIKQKTTGSKGSTGKAIAQGYASFYDRTAVFIDDLMNDEWESIFRGHYQYIDTLLKGFGDEYRPENATVSAYDDPEGKKHCVGSEDHFIDQLRKERKELRPYVSDKMYALLDDAWNNPDKAFTIEYGQGAGLDPWFGIYPDVTASRTTSRNIPDVTYGIVQPEDIAVRGTVFKTSYMSSVGIRSLPEVEDEETLRALQDENREYGKTTGRPRPPKHISIPLFQAMADYSGDLLLLPTHLDSGKDDRKIIVISHYENKDTGEEQPYIPFQKEMDKLNANAIVFEGFNGDEAKSASHPSELPPNLQLLLAFYYQTIRPIAIGSTGPGVKDYVSWLPKGY